MAWTSLRDSLGSKPLLLAGPILRQVTPAKVTVWLAMRVPATVTLTVVDDQGKLVMEGTLEAVSVGVNLHVAAVTAELIAGKPELTDGIVYQYDLTFLLATSTETLAGATSGAKLAYAPLTRPSFALPPADLNLLRVLQGSCRMPHAEGRDTLPLIDDLIAATATNAFARPHQLLLTGDQIYADDVSDALLLMLIDADAALLRWQEAIPGVVGGERYRTPIPACLRASVLGFPQMGKLAGGTAGFSSEDLQSHLMSLGEYLAMYLFTWSDVVWPPVLPTFDEVAAEVYKRLPRNEVWAWKPTVNLDPERIRKHSERVAEFSQTLWNVRRALANVPSYMIFDDHEVTDDWNMTRGFCSDAYGSKLGLRVIQNGLVAYALCQHWGNAPEQFDGPTKPGRKLLDLLDPPQSRPVGVAKVFPVAAAPANYDRNSPTLRGILGIHEVATLRGRDDHAVFHDSGSLIYNFSVEGPSHQVIFTDTRTWRAFPKKADGTHLLTRNRQTDQYKQQILDAPPTRDRLLFVALTTNAPPVQPIRAATRHDRLTNGLEHYPDVYEAWELPSMSLDRLLVALTSKLPLDASNQHSGAVIVLSGDVHHSFATRIMYRATKRYEDDAQPEGATAVVAQLVASSLKKQTDSTVRFQRKGYYAAPHPWISNRMIRHTLTEGYVGWNFPKGAKEKIGTAEVPGVLKVPLILDRRTLDVSRAESISGQPNSRKIDLTQTPHYRYRFDYLRPTEQLVEIPVKPIRPLPGSASREDRKKAAEAYDSATKAYRHYNRKKPPTVVGVNNVGEIRLVWGDAANRKANFILHWYDPDDSKLKSTTYSVRLDINSPTDPEFPDVRARTEP